MVKKKRKVQRSIVQEKSIFDDTDTSSTGRIHPSATLGPNSSLNVSTNALLLPRDSTNAPLIGEESARKDVSTQSSWPYLVEKHLLSKQSIYSIITILVISYIFIQDNDAGKLSNWDGIFWTIKKSTVVLSIILIVFAFPSIADKVFRFFKKYM